MFTCFISSLLVCLCCLGFVVVCLVSLLIYYGRIWVALSYCFLHYFLFYFVESCFESVCVFGSECEYVLWISIGSFFKLKPTLIQNEKGTKWASPLFLVKMCLCVSVINFPFQTCSTLASFNSHPVVLRSPTVPSRFCLCFVCSPENVYTYKVRHPKSN